MKKLLLLLAIVSVGLYATYQADISKVWLEVGWGLEKCEGLSAFLALNADTPVAKA